VFVILAGLLPVPVDGQRIAPDGPTAFYVQLVATHFNVDAGEVSILLEDVRDPDHLPVLLTLSRESGIPPAAVLSRRYRGGPNGEAWVSVARQLNLGAGAFYVEIPEAEVDDRTRRAAELFRNTSRANWNALDLNDAEVVALANVRFLSRQLGVGKGEVLSARARSDSWADCVRHLLGVP
jgi:hypothetical protein